MLAIGDLIVIEIALVHFFKDIDLSLAAGKQVQETVGKIEYQIAQIQTAAIKQKTTKVVPDPLKPSN